MTPKPTPTPTPPVWGLWSASGHWLHCDGWRCTFASEQNAMRWCESVGIVDAVPVQLVPAGSEAPAGTVRVNTTDPKFAAALLDFAKAFPKVEDGSTVIRIF